MSEKLDFYNAYIRCFHIDQASESSIDSNQRSLFWQTSRASFQVLLTSNTVNTSLWLAHWGKHSERAVTKILDLLPVVLENKRVSKIQSWQLLLCYLNSFTFESLFWKCSVIFTSYKQTYLNDAIYALNRLNCTHQYKTKLSLSHNRPSDASVIIKVVQVWLGWQRRRWQWWWWYM